MVCRSHYLCIWASLFTAPTAVTATCTISRMPIALCVTAAEAVGIFVVHAHPLGQHFLLVLVVELRWLVELRALVVELVEQALGGVLGIFGIACP